MFPAEGAGLFDERGAQVHSLAGTQNCSQQYDELRRGRDKTYRRCELMTLTFDLGDHRYCRSYASWYIVGVSSAHFGDTIYTTIRFRFMGHWAKMAQTDHVTLRP